MPNPKRFLLCKSGYDVNILWLDDHGTCDHVDINLSLYPKRFHMKRDEKGLAYALLCPNGLEQSEWTRVFVDDPPGSWMSQFAAYREAPPKYRQIPEQGG